MQLQPLSDHPDTMQFSDSFQHAPINLDFKCTPKVNIKMYQGLGNPLATSLPLAPQFHLLDAYLLQKMAWEVGTLLFAVTAFPNSYCFPFFLASLFSVFHFCMYCFPYSVLFW